MPVICDMCRLCMERSSSVMENIFVGETITAEDIRTVTRIEVIEGDGFPPHVCLLCIYKLNCAKTFIESCIDCNEKLKSQCMVQATIAPVLEESRSSAAVACLKTECETECDNNVVPTISRAFDVINSFVPITEPEGGIHDQLKTEPVEPSPNEAQPAFQQTGQDITVHEAEMTADEDSFKMEFKEEYEMIDEADDCDYLCSDIISTENVPELAAVSHETEEGSREDTNDAVKTSLPRLETELFAPSDAATIICRVEVDSVSTQSASCAKTALERSQEANRSINTDIVLPNNVTNCREDLAAEKTAATNTVDQMKTTARILQVPAKSPSSLRLGSGPRSLLRSMSPRCKRGLPCLPCGRTFPQLALLRQHACDPLQSLLFQCQDCSAGFYSRISLKIHRKQHKKYRCQNRPHSSGGEEHRPDSQICATPRQTLKRKSGSCYKLGQLPATAGSPRCRSKSLGPSTCGETGPGTRGNARTCKSKRTLPATSTPLVARKRCIPDEGVVNERQGKRHRVDWEGDVSRVAGLSQEVEIDSVGLRTRSKVGGDNLPIVLLPAMLRRQCGGMKNLEVGKPVVKEKGEERAIHRIIREEKENDKDNENAKQGELANIVEKKQKENKSPKERVNKIGSIEVRSKGVSEKKGTVAKIEKCVRGEDQCKVARNVKDESRVLLVLEAAEAEDGRLRSRIARKAARATPYHCWECGRVFAQGSKLITHFRRHLRATFGRHTQ